MAVTLQSLEERDKVFPGMVFVIDQDGIYRQVLAPSALRDRLYLPADNLLGEQVEAVLPAALAKDLRRELRLSLESKERRSFVYDLDVPAGNRRFEAHLSPCTVAEELPELVAVATFDVTNRDGSVEERSDRSGCVFYSVDRDLRVESFNRAAQDYFGLDPADILGVPISEVLPSSAHRHLLSKIEDVRESETPAGMVLDYDEYPRVSEEHIYPTDTGVSVISWDIPNVNEDLKQPAMELVSTVLESIPAVVCRTDVETGTMTFVTDAVGDIFGHCPDEWRANPALWQAAIHPADEDRVLGFVEDVWEGYEPGEIEYRITARDGACRWVRDQYRWESDDTGEVTSLLRIISDITESKQVRRRYATVVDNLPGIVFRATVSASNPPEYIHGECEQLTGYSCGGLAGKFGHLRSVIHAEDRDRVDRVLREARRHDSTYEISYRITTKEGIVKQVHEWGSPVGVEMIEGIILPTDHRVSEGSSR